MSLGTDGEGSFILFTELLPELHNPETPVNLPVTTWCLARSCASLYSYRGGGKRAKEIKLISNANTKATVCIKN